MSRFIIIEGIDGAGKTTLAKGLEAALIEQGEQVVMTREPGGTEKAEAIRRRLFSEEGQRLTPAEQMALVHEGRLDHVSKVIVPALAAGKTVISDRFEMSSLVYQAWLHPEELEQRYKLYEKEIAALLEEYIPEYLYLTLPAEVVKQRQAQSGEINAFDAVEIEPILDRISAYEWARKLVRGKLYKINANQTPDQVLIDAVEKIGDKNDILTS